MDTNDNEEEKGKEFPTFVRVKSTLSKLSQSGSNEARGPHEGSKGDKDKMFLNLVGK